MFGAKDPPLESTGEADARPRCARCHRVENAASLEQIAGVPFCHPCAEYARNRPFPKWLIWSLSALILLVAVAWVRNERFFRALILMRREQAAMERADLARSEELAVRAAALVPESDALAGVAAFQKGLRALQRDRSSEAVPLLLRAHSAFPDSKNISYLLASAEAGAAFESKKWDVFLQKALEVEKLEPGEPKSVAQVASAYAC